MNLNRTIHKVAAFAVLAVLVTALMTPTAFAQEPTPGFNNKIPESILTPDTVQTRVGALKFFDGIPTRETAALLFDNLDLNRGLQTILNGMPAANFEAGRLGHVDARSVRRCGKLQLCFLDHRAERRLGFRRCEPEGGGGRHNHYVDGAGGQRYNRGRLSR